MFKIVTLAKAETNSIFTNFHGQYFGPEAVTKSSCHNIFLITKNKALLLSNFLKKDIWYESLN